jgi:hypothetical protein
MNFPYKTQKKIGEIQPFLLAQKDVLGLNKK